MRCHRLMLENTSTEPFADTGIAVGQPYCLKLLQGPAMLISDSDMGLHDALQRGVHTGCLPKFPVIPSGDWFPPRPPKKKPAQNGVILEKYGRTA